jgi:hypothetical protein
VKGYIIYNSRVVLVKGDYQGDELEVIRVVGIMEEI